MLRLISLIALLVLSNLGNAQNWQWTELATMPFNTANNAVCEATVNGDEFVYSFGGIDTTKLFSGIHSRSFKYNVAIDSWSEVPPLPDPESKIASGASFVKGKIYIIGGYHVYANNNEISSSKVHIFDPQTDLYEADGAAIPLAIDDHVQCVYKDSLIFVVTGWSNSGNFPNVQIYDPSLDQWQNGTFVPTTFEYTAFGASGAIVGDTLYYHGGAAGGSFAARKFMRKGYINPADPTDITWELMGEAPGEAGYRSACSTKDNTLFWVGGSSLSYNYDGIAYNGSGGVDPSARVLHYNNSTQQYLDDVSQPYGVMDLRGIAKLSNNKWIICGGMDSTQSVMNRTFLLENSALGIEVPVVSELKIKYTNFGVEIESDLFEKAYLVDLNGKVMVNFDAANEFTIDASKFEDGMYLFNQGRKTIRLKL
ncbi:MAG: N-acetylneuraminic acid mutarotase [Crocinitomicaceae bacterium]|jgi:N-acetylneuraminic acid mutarotase